ncbi:UD11 glucuronosyltransferase, partial [Rhagologus leucostigma]|nr:UD11 glucuronosyltransferase [Rhagologus leucostigma]
ASVLLFLSLLGSASGGKLLVVPMDESHWLSLRSLLVALSQKGHQIVTVASEVNSSLEASEYHTLKRYPVPVHREELRARVRSLGNDLLEGKPFRERIAAPLEKVQLISNLCTSSCGSLLRNEDLVRYLQSTEFDAVLTDPLVPCGQILALRLSVPSVFSLRGFPRSSDLQVAQCPELPSYVPRTYTGGSGHMTFIQHVENSVLESIDSFLCSFAFLPFELLASDVLRKQVTVKEVLCHGSIWRERMDFVFGYPMPVMPNIIFTEGINCGKKKPLSQ